MPDSAFCFDGDDFIGIPYSEEIESSPFSLSVWFKISMTSNGAIMNSDPTTFPKCHHAYVLEIWPYEGQLLFDVDPSTGCGDGNSAPSENPLSDNQWHHAVAIYDAAPRLYVDVVFQGEGNALGYPKTHASIRVFLVHDAAIQWLKEERIYWKDA